MKSLELRLALTLSWVVGSVLAIAVAAYLPSFSSTNNTKAQNLGEIVKDMPKFFKFGFWWAALAWVTEIVISLWYAVVRLIYGTQGVGFSDEEVYCILFTIGGIAWFLVWRSKTGRVNQLSSKIGKLAGSLWKRLS